MQNIPKHTELSDQVMLLVDCSSSLAPCFDKLKNTLQSVYTAFSQSCLVGVGVYAENFQKISAPDVYKNELYEILGALKPAYKSNLHDALYGAADCFDLLKCGRKLIIIFSDGGYDGDEPFDAACELSSAGIELHAIGFSGGVECFAENLTKLTNDAFVRSCDAAAYINSLLYETERSTYDMSHNCCNEEICIIAETPNFGGFYTVNVQIGGACPCNAKALCVRLMLDETAISEKFLYVQRNESLPSVVTFIVPQSAIPNGRNINQICAYVWGNTILC